MFRRFMIVCWSLFGVAVLGIVVGLLMYRGSQLGADDIAIAWEVDSADFNEIRKGLIEANKEWTAYVSSLKRYSAKLKGRGVNVQEELKIAEEELAFISQDMAVLSRYEHRAYMGVGITGIGIAAAAAILTWNVLCLIANWVWRGREKAA